LPEALKTAEVCLEAVKQNFYALKYVPDESKTYEMCLIAVKQNVGAFRFVPETFKTAELWLEAVKGEPWLIKKVPKEFKTANFWLELVKAQGYARWFLDVPDEFKTLDMCIAAVKQAYWMFMLVPESLKEQVIKARIQGGYNYEYALKNRKNDFFEKEVERICIRLAKLSEKANKKGILSLKEDIDKERLSKKDLLETSLNMVISGKKHEIIEEYIDSWRKENCIADYEKILASITKVGVLCIQAGQNSTVEYRMTSLIPRDSVPDSLLREKETYFRRQK